MSNLSITNPFAYTKLAAEARITANPLQNSVQAIFPANSKVKKETGFLDAWLLSSNGQG